MAHVALVALSGTRVRERTLKALGVSLPGLARRAAAIETLPPLGLLSLAGLAPDDWTVSLHEAATVDDDLVHAIAATSPGLAAISALTASNLEAYALSARLRALGIAVVLGGLHVTACPDEAAAHADAVVIGEGEPVWRTLLDDARRGALRPDYRASRPFDLACSPVPRYDLLGRKARPRFTLQTTRGCPLACDFCGASRLLGPFRRKPRDRIEAELDAITAIDPRPSIELADDNTFAAGGPHDELLDALSASRARWFTEADWRLGENPAVLERLAEAGCGGRRHRMRDRRQRR